MRKPIVMHVEVGADLYYPYQVYEEHSGGRIHLNSYNDPSVIREDFPKLMIPEEVLTHFAQAQAWPIFYVESQASWVLVKKPDVERARLAGRYALGREPILTVRLATEAELLAFQSLEEEPHPFHYLPSLPKTQRP